MKKNIKVILKDKKAQDPRKRVKKVSRGYAFNYLVPKQMAEIATKGKIKHINNLYNKISKSRDITQNQNLKLKYKLDNIGILHIRKQCSSSKLLFGSITEQDIVDQVLILTGVKISKKEISVELDKKIGIYNASIMIDENIKTLFSLNILPKCMH